MAFTEAVVEQAWKRAGVKCEFTPNNLLLFSSTGSLDSFFVM
jgi:hypothetical protein